MALGASLVGGPRDRGVPWRARPALAAGIALLIIAAACSGGSRSQSPGATKTTSATPTAAKNVQLKWSAPERIDTNQGFASVSCPTASFCAATVASPTAGSVITWNGTSWSAPQVLTNENLGHV